MARKHSRAHCLNGCGNQLFSNDMMAKYCSPTCADAYINSFRGLCLNGCGQIVALSRQKYCSLKCQQTYQFRIRSAALEAGTYRAYNCNGFIRKYLISKIGEQCSRCGWHERHPRTGASRSKSSTSTEIGKITFRRISRCCVQIATLLPKPTAVSIVGEDARIDSAAARIPYLTNL